MSLTTGKTIETSNPIPGLITTTTGSWALQKQSYINGGITFNYPVGTFTAPPTVHIDIELLGLGYAITLLFTPIITSNTALSTTVRVNVSILGIILEASTGDVTVHLRAQQ